MAIDNNENIEQQTNNAADNMTDEQAADNTQNETQAEAQDSEEQTPAEEPKELTTEEKLEAALLQIEELKKQQLYKAAEFDNFRRRVMQEKAELIKNGGAKVISTILPILDDFERAQQNMDKLEDVAAVKEGVTLIIEKFLKLLHQEGLEKIKAVGEDFNTDFHEAIAMVPGMPEDQKNKVIDCVQDGYMLNEKVLRHAKVAVAE